MKIAAMSDWLSQKPNEVLSALQKLKPDCFVYAGDGLRGMTREVVEDILELTAQKAFLYVKGNHDWGLEKWWDEITGVHCLHNEQVFVCGVPFVGYSGISNKKK